MKTSNVYATTTRGALLRLARQWVRAGCAIRQIDVYGWAAWIALAVALSSAPFWF